MLFVHGLLADKELSGDLLPGPPEIAGVVHLKGLQLLQEPPKCRHGPKPDPRIPAARLCCQLGRFAHAVNIR